MSTFQGLVSELPQIRIDFFRIKKDHPPPLACFLSHMHSDHLAGLETLKAPFVYCSPATREILLRLEKWPHRVNFAKGIVESRVQTYQHLKNILKPIPLDCPTTIELAPGLELRVTLIDANHCAGAVMFLIEGQGKAILYTGDIRAEQWWIDSLERHPVLISYASGIKKLDQIYLDTTFATKSNPHRCFQTKAQGIAELLHKVDAYPSNTIFYLEAWTFGYEDVWIALANHLQTQVHLDRYRWGIYKSLTTQTDQAPCREAPALCGYKLGNHRVPGCLTANVDVRIHSCERSDPCAVIRDNPDVVRLMPIINRLKDGSEIQELGIGGGKGDLDQIHELELFDLHGLQKLLDACTSKASDPKKRTQLTALIRQVLHNTSNGNTFRLDADLIAAKPPDVELTLNHLIEYFTQKATKEHSREHEAQLERVVFSRSIRFPYSRHSSYEELRALVRVFKPRDVYPCTVVDEKYWRPELSMRSLFGDICASAQFKHDDALMKAYMARQEPDADLESARSSQATTESEADVDTAGGDTRFFNPKLAADSLTHAHIDRLGDMDNVLPSRASKDYDYQSTDLEMEDDDRLASNPSAIITPATKTRTVRDWAYLAASGSHEDCQSWCEFGGLICTRSKARDDEL